MLRPHHIAYDILTKGRRAGHGEFQLGQEHLRELTRHLTPRARLALIGQQAPIVEQHVIDRRLSAAARRNAA